MTKSAVRVNFFKISYDRVRFFLLSDLRNCMCFLPIFLSLLISFYIRWENPSFIDLALNIQARGSRNLCQLYDWQNKGYFLYFFLIVLNLRLMKKVDLCDNKERSLSHHKGGKERGEKLQSS